MATKLQHISLFVSHTESDALIMDILGQHFGKVLVCESLKDVCRQLVDKTPKIFLMTGDTLEQTLHCYYRSLDAVSKFELCEHRVVSLIPRQFEKEAFDAFRAQLIDDYMVARPVYELHRIILICEHLLIELGVALTGTSYSSKHKEKQIEGFDSALQISVKNGLARKNDLMNDFENSLVEIENTLEIAAGKIAANQTVSIDMEKLKETLSAIKSDAIRPELLRLQNKAIHLLEQSLNIKPDTPHEERYQDPDVDEPGDIEEAAAEPTIKVKEQYMFNRLYQQDVDPEKLIAQNNALPKILVVEDDVISQHLTTKLLKTFGVQLELAQNGRQAFALLTSKKFDMVLMDVNLPDSNGIYIVDKATSDGCINKTTPIIMLSGDKNKATAAQAMERGAKAYIVKPLHKKSVESLFAKFLNIYK